MYSHLLINSSPLPLPPPPHHHSHPTPHPTDPPTQAPRTLRLLRVTPADPKETRDKDAVAALLAHFGQGGLDLFHPY